ncbi:BREX system serine/threonine kinase PglW [Ilumatobacter coccineus]|uniref:BREX system serine/threonine kinase PglW n=1 Tax=Ilumatobacter coccineus TaxID=467094 RepID=UPI00138AF3DB|nr:BREX system serine/threonine kinase PglW [Ilumatobacter coccineus]
MTVSDSPHDHEREALAWLRSRLPDREPYHVWTNFEFTTHNGQMYEVDALAITDNGVHLIEFKAYPGRIDGDGGTWQWRRPDGKFRQIDNPRQLANRKAKALKSLIENTKTFKGRRNEVPYLSECVFLSDPKLISGLNPQGRHQVFGRDADGKGELPPERKSLGGIVDHLVSLNPDDSGRARKRLPRPVAAKLVKAIGEIGIRERSSRRTIGDYEVGALLSDVESDPTTAVTYQDFLGTHRSADDVQRRLRVYPLEHNATAEQRETAERAARREFELLSKLEHPGIIKPLDFTISDRGPTLFFGYDPDEVTLPEFLADPANASLSVDHRLSMVRDIAEAVAYAHRQGVFHRSISPSGVMVRPSTVEGGSPRVRVTNWHTGARVVEGGTTTQFTGTIHHHVEALAAGDADLYRAPEFNQPNARPPLLDVFSLGALAMFVLTGKPPAAGIRQFRAVLSHVGFLDPSTVADGVDPTLADVVISSTQADPAQRPTSVEDLIAHLDLAEEQWSLPSSAEISPLEARRGDRLVDDRFEVVQRLGRGSTAIALLVKDSANHNQLCVLKVAEDPANNDRITDEALALDGIKHQTIVSLLDAQIDVSGHAAILISYAGPKVNTDKPVEGQGRTLASRLTGGPVGAELAERWGLDLLDALRYLEDAGRAHRDIKPENLGVAPLGENNVLHLVLFDFSLSLVPIDRIEAGTPGYVDPFLERRGRWDTAADRYAATVTLYMLTTGTKPRYGDGSVDPTMVDAPPNVDPDLFDSAARPGLVSFFTKALQADVADRFDTADEMYFAWHEAFSASAAPSTPSTHPEADDDFTIPDGSTLSSPLLSLPLSKRAVSALETADVVTIEQLLAFPLMQLSSLTNVGSKTRGEIREAFDVLSNHFGPLKSSPDETPAAGVVSTEPDPADHSLAALAALIAPPARTKDLQTRAGLARILAGLEVDRDPWASQSELAEWLDVTPARVSQLVSKLRQAWSKVSRITELRDVVRDDLRQLQVASAPQLAARLLRTAPDELNESSVRLASGLLRVATLTEEQLSEPGWMVRRRQGSVVLSTMQGTGGADLAQELADYASALDTATEALMARHEVIARRELVDALRTVDPPAEAQPFTDSHLADLVADLCDGAAVNARLELYRVGLAPVPALRAARRSFVSNEPMTVEAIAKKIAARFPEANSLPGRPQLDTSLSDAGVDLKWDDAAKAYVSPQYTPHGTSAYSASITRYDTAAPGPVPAVEVDNAAEFEDRLRKARTSGGLMVLVQSASGLAHAERQLERLATSTVNLDVWLVEELEALTADGKPPWTTLAAADAAGDGGSAWANVKKMVDVALTKVTARLAALEGTVLVTNLGLLARYERLNVVAEWRDLLHSKSTSLSAVWLLMPSASATEVPLLDGRAVPVISRNEWSQIPADWLRNAHRTGVVSA